MGRKKLKEIQTTQSFSPILGIRDGIIMTKDFRFVKILEVLPINFELRSPYEQEEIVSNFSAAIRTMPRVVHLKIVNTPSDVSQFLDDLRKCIELEKSDGCKALQKDQLALIRKVSQTQGVSRRFFLSFEYEDLGGFRKSPSFETIRTHLNRQARSIISTMEACGNVVIANDEDAQVLEILYTLMNRTAAHKETFREHYMSVIRKYQESEGKIIDPKMIPVNDFLSPGKIDFSMSPRYVYEDGKYTMHCFLPASAYPLQTYGGWMQILFAYFDGVDIDFWIRKEQLANVQRRLAFELKNNRIKMKNTEDISQDYEDIVAALESGYYIKQQLANGDDFCYMSTMISITGESIEDMNAKYKEVKDHLLRNDMSIRRCDFQQQEAHLASLPMAAYSKGIFSKSKRNIMGSQLGSCYPFTAYELADPGGIFFGINTRYGSPVFLNIFDRQKYRNANMLILGPSGAGKTYTLLSMLLRMREKRLQIFAIAPFKGSEFKRSCDAVGGEYVRIAPGSTQNINIMEIRKHDSESVLVDGVEMGTSGSILTDKIQQIARFFSLLVPDLSVEEQHLLDDALIRTYAKMHITPKNKSLYDPANPGQYRKMPVLGDLYDQLRLQGEAATRMINALARYVTGSAKSFNQQTNVNLNNKYVVLDVSDMTKESLPVGMFIALDYVMDMAKADKTENKVIAIDEMWRLMAASKLTAEFAVEVFKIIRGYGGSAIGATQDLHDVLNDESGAAIVNNAQIKFFLPMERKEVEEVSRVVDLTAEEMKQMKMSKTTKKTDRKILMVAGANHVFISVKTSQREHDLITTSADDLKRIAQRAELNMRKGK